MSNNIEVRDELGMFRGEILYQTSFLDEYGNVFASLFVIQQLTYCETSGGGHDLAQLRRYI